MSFIMATLSGRSRFGSRLSELWYAELIAYIRSSNSNLQMACSEVI